MQCHRELSEGSAKVLIGRFFVAFLLRMTGFKHVSNIEINRKCRVALISELVESYYTQGERFERSFWEVAADRPWRSRESASMRLNTRRSPALTTACSWDSEMATG